MASRRIVVSSARRTDPSESQPESARSVSRALGGHDLYMVRLRRVWRPPTDVYETDNHLVVKVEIAGMDEDELDVSLVDRRLVVAGHRHAPEAKLLYQNMEIRYGEFRTEVHLGWAVDRDAIEASYSEGFLFVYLPKAQEYRVPIAVRRNAQDAS